MTKQKSTKRALLLSALSLLMCVSMLIGSTFAWFTDSVTSGNNIIKSGNLDIELEYWNGTAWKDVKGASDILTNTLWEPGVTEVAYLRVANAGSLALKYQLGINILNEIEGKNQAGDTFRLSNYIMFGVVEGVNGATGAYTKDDAGRTKAIAAVADAKKIYEGYTKASTMNAGDELYLALVVYMPTTVGNEANHDGEKIPEIDLGINVYATQYTYENDSFNNQYDANASFSLWNGVVPTEMPESLVVDGATQTVHVKDAAAFAYLSTLSAKWVDLYTDGSGTTYTNYANGAGANYYYSGKWKVSLEADIDLNNHDLDPVEIVFGQSTGATAFNGNGHTIRNINAGLFADGTRASFSNLTLENVKATNGALAGSVNHSVTDVTVKNATISGVDYVGGLAGQVYSSVTRCKVIDSSVVATGKEAGGLIGYAEANSKGSTIVNNVVNNVSVHAGNRAAGLVAQPNTTVKVYNNTVDTVTVYAADASKYQPGAVVSNALTPENVYDNTVKDVTVDFKHTTEVSTVADLEKALANGDNVVLTGDIALTKTLMATKDAIIDLNGKTIKTTASTSLFQSQSNAAPSMIITSSVPGAVIDATNSTLNNGVVHSYGKTEIRNVTINAGTNKVVQVQGNGSVEIYDTVINAVSGNTFNVAGDFTLGEGTVVNVTNLNSNLINNNGAHKIVINGAEINIGTFKVNGSSVISLNQASTLEMKNTDIKIDNFVLSPFGGDSLVSKVDGVTIEDCTFDITDSNGASCTFVAKDGKYRLVQK